MASDAGSGDFLGEFVALYGDVMVAGTIYDDEKGTDAGCIYEWMFLS